MFQFGVNLVPLNPLPRIAIPTSCFTRHSLSGMSLDKRFEHGIDFLKEEIVEISLDRVLQLPKKCTSPVHCLECKTNIQITDNYEHVLIMVLCMALTFLRKNSSYVPQ